MASSQLLQRLLNQLHALSEVNETLTVRLLELEERVELMNQKIAPAPLEMHEGDRILLAASDLRIERINGLLDPIQLPRETAQEPIPEAPLELIADLNYEEEQEQLFMDEAA
ncbi:hypothetical protein [Synechococcus sp. UW140]|uniref:hypothetical protein n=1 Tax=Synechococcus sp. UW140 TaxID=368503 RepID=UPI0025F0C8F3|nr:hypothetical protein [Synechococcus sp. UW140]